MKKEAEVNDGEEVGGFGLNVESKRSNGDGENDRDGEEPAGFGTN